MTFRQAVMTENFRVSLEHDKLHFCVLLMSRERKEKTNASKPILTAAIAEAMTGTQLLSGHNITCSYKQM